MVTRIGKKWCLSRPHRRPGPRGRHCRKRRKTREVKILNFKYESFEQNFFPFFPIMYMGSVLAKEWGLWVGPKGEAYQWDSPLGE